MAKLIIAGYGFLGEVLDQVFSQAGWEVEKLSRSGKRGCVACDISSPDDVVSLEGEYDLIIHCAASGGGGEASYRAVYLEGSRNLLDRFPKAKFIFTSSTSVYAQTDHSEVTEMSLAEPTTATGRILRETEDLVLKSGGTVTRLSGLYGQGRCHVLKNLLNGTARLDGSGERVMNFIHRDDVAKAMLMLTSLETVGGIYNVSADPVSQHDCYAMLADHFKKPMPPTRDTDVPRKRGNSSKKVLNAKLKGIGWEPQYHDFLSMSLACEVD